ncbi:MAG: CBS and ACT domain-containing protein [Calditrichaceae bacterium]
MLVHKWMSKKVITVDENESLSEAINMLKRNRIRRLPVMRKDKLVGIVSDRDLKEASPSKASSLDIWELHYLMSRIKVKDIMTRSPITVLPEATIERAAILMHDNKIGGLPVVDNKQKLIGIVTEQDIFEALINITGARVAAYRISLVIPDTPGSIKEVCDLMRKENFKCISILTTQHGLPEGSREVLIRFQADEKILKSIIAELKKEYKTVELTVD